MISYYEFTRRDKPNVYLRVYDLDKGAALWRALQDQSELWNGTIKHKRRRHIDGNRIKPEIVKVTSVCNPKRQCN